MRPQLMRLPSLISFLFPACTPFLKDRYVSQGAHFACWSTLPSEESLAAVAPAIFGVAVLGYERLADRRYRAQLGTGC